MKRKLTKRQKINRMVVGSLRDTINTHGPITSILIGSAAKRITSTILSGEKK